MQEKMRKEQVKAKKKKKKREKGFRDETLGIDLDPREFVKIMRRHVFLANRRSSLG